MSTTTRRAAAMATAVALTAVALVACGRHGTADTTGTTSVAPITAGAPTTETTPTTATTAAPAPTASAVDPAALARLEHDLAGATSDLDTADQQLKAARTEATTDPRG